ncbi:MAG: Fe-S cluster protein [Desulfomonile tiedjei]|uniref:Fe-S cluster protein n=1 Tax=Desulfomonile tiedjei TaxID=2358 RepID=A0A9D6V2L9_9BACT|nr:Fe-S cluster protein [Desulfomonile tiedjei]
MLLTGYTKELFLPKCNPKFQSVHCVARLNEDVSEALPYLNTFVGGGDYVKSPPSLTIRAHGKLITVHSREIFVNALKDETEAERILGWLRKQINEAWENREQIKPTFEAPPAPQMMEILKLLPRTNCKKCGEPTCTVFAIRATEGVKEPDNCPGISHENRPKLEQYLAQFEFDI